MSWSKGSSLSTIPMSYGTISECNICFNTNESNHLVVLQCNHIFHKECLNDWLEHIDNRCPTCDAVIREVKDTWTIWDTALYFLKCSCM